MCVCIVSCRKTMRERRDTGWDGIGIRIREKGWVQIAIEIQIAME